jgi:hypothetical protein
MKFEQRAMAFMSAMMCFLSLFAVLRVWKGLSFLPNLEWILPTLIVLGSLFPFEFGILALVFVQVLWTLLYGPKPIQIFTCSGFALVWFLARKRHLSPLWKFEKINRSIASHQCCRDSTLRFLDGCIRVELTGTS